METPYYLPLALPPGAEPPEFYEDGVLDLAIRVPAPFEEDVRAVPLIEGSAAFEAFVEDYQGARAWEDEEEDGEEAEGEADRAPYALPITLLQLLSHKKGGLDNWVGLPEYLVRVGLEPCGTLTCSPPIRFFAFWAFMHSDLASARLRIPNEPSSEIYIPRQTQGFLTRAERALGRGPRPPPPRPSGGLLDLY